MTNLNDIDERPVLSTAPHQGHGFGYHFWTNCVTKLNKYKKKTDPDPLSDIEDEE